MVHDDDDDDGDGDNDDDNDVNGSDDDGSDSTVLEMVMMMMMIIITQTKIIRQESHPRISCSGTIGMAVVPNSNCSAIYRITCGLCHLKLNYVNRMLNVSNI